MTKHIRWLVLALGIGSLALAILIGRAPSVGAAPGPTAVTVTNTPLPVSGTVGIDGTPTVELAKPAIFRMQLPAGGWVNDTGGRVVIELVTGVNITTIVTLLHAGLFSYRIIDQGCVQSPCTLYALTKIYLEPGERLAAGWSAPPRSAVWRVSRPRVSWSATAAAVESANAALDASGFRTIAFEPRLAPGDDERVIARGLRLPGGELVVTAGIVPRPSVACRSSRSRCCSARSPRR